MNDAPKRQRDDKLDLLPREEALKRADELVADAAQHAAQSARRGQAQETRSQKVGAMSAPILESLLTCPECGFAKSEAMQTDA